MLWCSYMVYRTFRVMIEQDEQNTFHASVPALPGCHSWGDSLAEARANIREAIELYVEDLVAKHESIPEEASFDTFETVALPA